MASCPNAPIRSIIELDGINCGSTVYPVTSETICPGLYVYGPDYCEVEPGELSIYGSKNAAQN